MAEQAEESKLANTRIKQLEAALEKQTSAQKDHDKAKENLTRLVEK